MFHRGREDLRRWRMPRKREMPGFLVFAYGGAVVKSGRRWWLGGGALPQLGAGRRAPRRTPAETRRWYHPSTAARVPTGAQLTGRTEPQGAGPSGTRQPPSHFIRASGAAQSLVQTPTPPTLTRTPHTHASSCVTSGRSCHRSEP